MRLLDLSKVTSRKRTGHPSDWIMKPDVELNTDNEAGVKVNHNWKQNDGDFEVLELIDTVEQTGSFEGLPTTFQKKQIEGSNKTMEDKHGAAKEFLKSKGTGKLVNHQLFVYFNDNAPEEGIVVPNSGYKITRVLTKSGNTFRLTITIVGAAVTIGKHSSDAGNGSLSKTIEFI